MAFSMLSGYSVDISNGLAGKEVGVVDLCGGSSAETADNEESCSLVKVAEL